MLKNRCISGRNCTLTAITAYLVPFRPSRIILGWLLFLLWTGLPALGDTTVATGIPSNVSINGPGYLLVRDPANGLLAVTRNGVIDLDANGFLTTSSGMRVQGFADSALSVVGDLQINAAGRPGANNSPAQLLSYEIQTNGQIVVTLSDDTSFVRCQILLQSFQNPGLLTQIWNSMFVWPSAAGPLPQPVPPGSSGTSSVQSGYLNQMIPELHLSRWAGSSHTFSQGFLVDTSISTDLGIQGNGFFVLRRTNDSALFATRAGAFYVDGGGYLVHYSGLRLQGYRDAALASIGDLQIEAVGSPSTSNPTVLVEAFGIDQRGVITEVASDGTSFARGQVLLQNCSHPDALNRASFDLYPISTSNGLWSPLATPFTGGLGWLSSGSVELSHFDTNLLAVRSHLNFFSQGMVVTTGQPANLAIMGLGFFTVRDPAANIFYATRLGDFQLDSLGHLVTTNGLRLQGVANAGLTQSGDITIDTAGAPDPSLEMTSYSIDRQGNIFVTLSDGSQFLRGQVLLQSYRNLQGLSPDGAGLYSNLIAAAPVFTNGLSGYVEPGAIASGCVEQPAPVPALRLLPAAGFRLLINNYTDGTVEASSDLRHWDIIGPINYGVLNQAEYFDTSPTTQRFYRVVMHLPGAQGISPPISPVPITGI